MKKGFSGGLTLALMAVCLIAGIFIGLNRRSVEYSVITRFVYGETIRDSIEVPVPYLVEIPKFYRLPTITETVFVNDTLTIVERVDTLQIIRDFVAINHYKLNVFSNDTVGVFDVNLSVQYNLLRSFDYSFTPMIREVTRTVQPALIPFASVSTNTFQTVGIGGGVLLRNIGFEYQFLHNHSLNNSGHQISLMYRFR